MMITRYTPIPEVVHWLMPDTARYLDQQDPETQILTLMALRDWMCNQGDNLDSLDPIDLSAIIDRFVRSFVQTSKGEPDA